MITTCEHCGKPFKTRPAFYRRRDHHFCSKQCFYASGHLQPKRHTKLAPRVVIHCAYCSRAFNVRASQQTRQYCSYRCRGLATRGENSPVWQGGYEKRRQLHNLTPPEWSALREKILQRDAHKCFRCGNAADTIHHMDKNTTNNEPSNLVTVCKGCHFAIHRKAPKLTPMQVREIRQSTLSSSRRELAQKFNVSVSTIQHIQNGRSWRWLE